MTESGIVGVSVCCNEDTWWQICSCDKNPEGLIPQPKTHGNIQDDGSTLCEDDYCSPRTDFIILNEDEDDNDYSSENYIKTHEVHERCSKCNQIQEARYV